jgi:hypothetical protein
VRARNDGRACHQRRDLAGIVQIRLRPCDDGCKDDDRAEGEVAQPLAHRRTTETNGPESKQLLDHALIIRFDCRLSQIGHSGLAGRVSLETEPPLSRWASPYHREWPRDDSLGGPGL